MNARVAVFAVTLALQASCDARRSAPAASASRGSCEAAARDRGKAADLLAQGHLIRSEQRLDRADSSCPASVPDGWATRVLVLARLGRAEKARALAAEIEATRDAPAAARTAAKTARDHLATAGDVSGRALVRAGLAAHAEGRAGEARALLDRAMTEIETATGKPMTSVPALAFPGGAYDLALGADGRTLAMVVGKVVSVRDGLDGWREILRLVEPGEDILRVTFSPDGKTLATASRGGAIRLWDLVKGEERHRFRAELAEAMAFAPDGKSLIGGTSGGYDARGPFFALHLWSTETAGGLPPFENLGEAPHLAAFSLDGRDLATAPRDNSGVRLWKVETRAQVRTLETRYPCCFSPSHLAFSRDGKTIVSLTSGTVERWDVATGKRNRADFFDKTAPFLALSTDGSLAAQGDGAREGSLMRLWNVSKLPPYVEDLRSAPGLLGELEGHTQAPTVGVFSGDGKVLASSSPDGTVRIWNVDGLAQVAKLDGAAPAEAVCVTGSWSFPHEVCRERAEAEP